MNEKEFISELSNLKININEKQLQLLKLYALELINYNEHTNLTAIKTIEEIYLKHFYDSLTVCQVIDINNQSVLDIGTGAGFPGIVLKIIFPEINLTLLDSNNKKIKFLEYIINKLELKKINLVNERAEDYIMKKRNAFDIVVSRAVANLRVLVELSLPYLKINGLFIAMKANCIDELKESENTIKFLNSKIDDIKKIFLPKENSLRTLIVIKRNGQIDDKYPRKYDQILKNNIC